MLSEQDTDWIMNELATMKGIATLAGLDVLPNGVEEDEQIEHKGVDDD